MLNLLCMMPLTFPTLSKIFSFNKSETLDPFLKDCFWSTKTLTVTPRFFAAMIAAAIPGCSISYMATSNVFLAVSMTAMSFLSQWPSGEKQVSKFWIVALYFSEAKPNGHTALIVIMIEVSDFKIRSFCRVFLILQICFACSQRWSFLNWFCVMSEGYN